MESLKVNTKKNDNQIFDWDKNMTKMLTDFESNNDISFPFITCNCQDIINKGDK